MEVVMEMNWQGNHQMTEADIDFLMFINKLDILVSTGLLGNIDKNKLFPSYCEIIDDIRRKQKV
jgi:hypothetical protein